ncbi:MAG: cupin domain-containing protein [Thermoleophilia bacterium]|nr:cupin domain-containing protein [Thermoleophilia bacterium]
METGIGFTDLADSAENRFVTLRRHLGVTSMGINQIVLAPGERGRIHAHERQEEVFLVLEGTLTLVVEGTEHDMPRGRLARVAPEVRRQLVNRGPGRVVLLALGAAGTHEGRDALAYRDWDDADPVPPQEVPLPADLPAAQLRTA